MIPSIPRTNLLCIVSGLQVVSRRKVGMTNGDCNKFFLYSKVAQDRELGFGRHVKNIKSCI